MPNNSELDRVSSRIQSAVKAFCKTRLQTVPLFFMRDLARYVSSYPGMKVAPASTDRILRAMRAKGLVNYEVVNRSKSFYKITAVA